MKNESKLTWKDVVKEALAEIGNTGHLEGLLKNKRTPEDRTKSNMERHRKTYLTAVQQFLSGRERERDMVSQGRKAS